MIIYKWKIKKSEIKFFCNHSNKTIKDIKKAIYLFVWEYNTTV